MAGGTVVQYGDVWIKDCETLTFSQELTYDESNTDVMFSRFRIRVRGSVHPDQLQTHATQFGTAALPGTSGSLVQLLHARLQRTRQIFNYTVDGVSILYVEPTSGSHYGDVNNGPKPIHVDIVQVVGARLYRVEFEVEVSVVKCTSGYMSSVPDWPPAGIAANPRVLNHRWTCHEERDANFFNTRVVEGTLRVSHADHWPHTFRYLVVPPLQRGYKRESQRFIDSADGLSLRYTITDKQRYAAPPCPAVDWYATYTESTADGGATGYGDMRVILDGAPNCDKQQLLQAAICVVLERLRGLNAIPGSADFSKLLHLAIVEHLHQPRIEVTAHVLHPNSGQLQNNPEWSYLNTRIARVRNDLVGDYFPDYDPELWPIPSPYAHSTAAGSWCHYWQDPCVDIHGMPGSVTLSPESPEEDPREKKDGGDDDDTGVDTKFGHGPATPPSEDPGVLTSAPETFPYTYYNAEVDYDTRTGMVLLPRAYLMEGGLLSTKDPNFSPAAFYAHSGVSDMVLRVHGERIGAWPIIPAIAYIPHDGGSWFLVRHKIMPSHPHVMADGRTKLYRLQVEYHLRRAPGIDGASTLLVPTDPRVIPDTIDIQIPLAEVATGGIL